MDLDADITKLQQLLSHYDVKEPTDTRRLRGYFHAGNYQGMPIIIELRDHGTEERSDCPRGRAEHLARQEDRHKGKTLTVVVAGKAYANPDWDIL